MSLLTHDLATLTIDAIELAEEPSESLETRCLAPERVAFARICMKAAGTLEEKSSGLPSLTTVC